MNLRGGIFGGYEISTQFLTVKSAPIHDVHIQGRFVVKQKVTKEPLIGDAHATAASFSQGFHEPVLTTREDQT